MSRKTPRRWPLACLQASILALSFHSLIAAEGPVATVQDSLKRQQFYFGERTGVVDDATRAALRRFQIRYGLPCTGEIDGPTLQALAGNPAAVQATPESQVAASKVAPQPATAVVEKDRQFLQKIETGLEAPPTTVQVSPPTPPPSAPPVVVRETAPPVAPPASAPSMVISRPVENPVPSRPVSPSTMAVAPFRPPVAESRPPQPVRRELSVATQPAAPAVASKPTYIEINAKSDAPRQEAAKPAVVANRQSERSRTAQSRMDSGSQAVKPAPMASAPPRRTEARTSAPEFPIVVEAMPPGPVPSRGTQVIRTTTTGTGPDGRTYVHEKTTTITTGKRAPEIEIRRALPVEPRRKAPGFRLFKDDDD